jgi:hypothetical protein
VFVPAENQTEPESQEESQKAAESEAALRKELEDARIAQARAEGEASALSNQPEPEAPKAEPEKQYTRAELQALVDDSTISEIERDQRLEDQLRVKILAEVRAENKVQNDANQSANKTQGEFDAYTKMRPDLLVKGSPDHNLASEEYAKLLKMGCEPGALTELIAVRNKFGPSEKIQEINDRETHAEGAGGQTGDPASQKSSGWRGDCSKDEVAYYEEMIKTGQYSGEADPNFKKDVAFAAKRRKAN